MLDARVERALGVLSGASAAAQASSLQDETSAARGYAFLVCLIAEGGKVSLWLLQLLACGLDL
jgi:hypothetical protein